MNKNLKNQTNNFGIPGTAERALGVSGCQAITNGRKCGETNNLQIIQEFRRLYETKMQEIDEAAGGDCLQAKINLQQEWIRDLTDQNEMLVRVVEELEVEAAERVVMLEGKLQQTVKCACENEKMVKEKDKKIQELEDKIKLLEETAVKSEEAQKACQQYAELKKSTLDMRVALTAEVAEKHDTILLLRRDMSLLEDRCRQAYQQTNFKDNIIKELRREIKHAKLQKVKKSRSPRTIKKSDQRPSHFSRTDPESNIHNLKDGTIVIRDTATVGDNITTQNIKEKYTDPSNQTIVYICESVPQRQKSRNHNQPDGEISFNQSRNADERSFEVSLDDACLSKSQNLSGNTRNSKNLTADLPRDVTGDYDNTLNESNYLIYPSIHETCIRYSRDLLNSLKHKHNSRNVAEHFSRNESKNCDRSKQRYEREMEGKKTFLNDSVTHSTENNNSFDRKNVQNVEMCPKNVVATVQNVDMCAKNVDATVQTVDCGIYNKDTQTNQSKLCDFGYLHSQSFNIPEPLFIENNLDNKSEFEYIAKNNNCCSSLFEETNEDVIKCLSPSYITHENYETDLVASQSNNKCIHGNDISFDEAEIRAYSSPFPENLASSYKLQPINSQDIYNVQRNFVEVYPNDYIENLNMSRPHRTNKICPAQYISSPKMGKPKILNPKTVCKISRLKSVPLTVRHSLPVCRDTKQNLHRPGRLRKLNKQNCLKTEYDFIDVPIVLDDRNFCRTMATSELPGLMIDGARENQIRYKKLIRGDCCNPRPNMDNTY